MAATISNLTFNVEGDLRRNFGTLTGDSSYTTGGYSLTAGQFGLGTVIAVDFNVFTNGTTSKALYWTGSAAGSSSAKAQSFDAAGTETAATTNLSAYTVTFEAVGF